MHLASPCRLPFRAPRQSRRWSSVFLADVLEALLRLLFEAPQDHRFELGRGFGPHPAKGHRGIGGDHRAHRSGRLALERRRAGEELVEDDPERPDVGSAIDVLRAPELLRRHVKRRAHHCAGSGEAPLLASHFVARAGSMPRPVQGEKADVNGSINVGSF